MTTESPKATAASAAATSSREPTHADLRPVSREPPRSYGGLGPGVPGAANRRKVKTGSRIFSALPRLRDIWRKPGGSTRLFSKSLRVSGSKGWRRLVIPVANRAPSQARLHDQGSWPPRIGGEFQGPRGSLSRSRRCVFALRAESSVRHRPLPTVPTQRLSACRAATSVRGAAPGRLVVVGPVVTTGRRAAQ
ncbi:MAG: hypothetical protein QOF83_3182 [Solirubrobacteraceae bacterium]|jgi:hypothetical protein|nr:hypothetical protein [Solirubrobacteraceae bacterium]